MLAPMISLAKTFMVTEKGFLSFSQKMEEGIFVEDM